MLREKETSIEEIHPSLYPHELRNNDKCIEVSIVIRPAHWFSISLIYQKNTIPDIHYITMLFCLLQNNFTHALAVQTGHGENRVCRVVQ